MKPPSLTIGIEEEYQIIDPETRELRSYITQLLEHDRPVSVGALIGLDLGELDLGELRQLISDLLLVELVVAGDGGRLLVGHLVVSSLVRWRWGEIMFMALRLRVVGAVMSQAPGSSCQRPSP